MVFLAIVGARSFSDYELLRAEVTKQCAEWKIDLADIKCIVGGHCQGADLLGEQFAKQHRIKTCVLKPDWKKYGKSAGFRRNIDIVNAATHIIAFPSTRSSGTQHTIKLAKQLGKPCFVVNFD